MNRGQGGSAMVPVEPLQRAKELARLLCTRAEPNMQPAFHMQIQALLAKLQAAAAGEPEQTNACS